MEDLNELKKSILLMEKMARIRELRDAAFPHLLSDVVEGEAALYRTAAACMWEKLERLEKSREAE